MPSDERPEQTTIECPNRWVLDTATWNAPASDGAVTPEGSALQRVATLGTRGGSPHPVDGGIRPVGGWPKPERESGEDTPLLFNPGDWHLPKYKLWELQKLAIADPNASDALRDQLFDDIQIARAAAARTIARKTGRGFDPAAASQLAERITDRSSGFAMPPGGILSTDC